MVNTDSICWLILPVLCLPNIASILHREKKKPDYNITLIQCQQLYETWSVARLLQHMWEDATTLVIMLRFSLILSVVP
jgi:hypothetical protein